MTFKHSCRWCDERRQRVGWRRPAALILALGTLLLHADDLTFHHSEDRTPSVPSTTYPVNISLPNKPTNQEIQP